MRSHYILLLSSRSSVKRLSSTSSTIRPPLVIRRASNEVERSPLIVMLGWGGAKYEHLDKFATQLYQKNGYSSVAFVSNYYMWSLPTAETGRNIAPVFENNQDEFREFQNRDIVLHIFSMSGIRSFLSLLRYLEETNQSGQMERVKGVIFDSCPVYTEPGPDSIAVSLIAPVPKDYPISNETRRHLMRVLFSCRYYALNILGALYPPILQKFSLYYYLRERVRLPEKQLYLYSEVDDMCHHSYISSFIETQKTSGLDVSKHCWPDSPHVNHYRAYPEEYSEFVVDFLRRL